MIFKNSHIDYNAHWMFAVVSRALMWPHIPILPLNVRFLTANEHKSSHVGKCLIQAMLRIIDHIEHTFLRWNIHLYIYIYRYTLGGLIASNASSHCFKCPKCVFFSRRCSHIFQNIKPGGIVSFLLLVCITSSRKNWRQKHCSVKFSIYKSWHFIDL